MAQILLNNVTTKLTAAITNVATSVSVTAGTGALFALATGGNTIRATLVKTSGYKEVAWEIVDITARSSDTLTITRALEGTTGLAFAIGDVLDCRITAGTSYENTNGNLNFNGATANIKSLTAPLTGAVGTKEGWRVDTNGNLGLGGATPSAWAAATATNAVIQCGNSSWAAYLSGATGMFTNLYHDGTNYRYVSSAAGAYINISSGATLSYQVTPSGTAGAVATMTTMFSVSSATGNVTLNAAGATVHNVNSINGGQLAGFRNVIRNGGAQVAQRTAPTLSAAAQYGAVDGFQVYIISGTGVSGTVIQSSSTSFLSGKAVGISAAGWTTGQVIVTAKVESVDCQNMNSKTVTFSCKVYHDFGANRTFSAQLLKANTLDNFGATTSIGTFASVSCASGAVTVVSGSLTLGATDAANGLMVQVFDNAANTVVNKNVLMGDWQLEIGSVASTFEQVPYAMQLEWCRRYLVVAGHQVPATTAQNIRPLNMRITPTITGGGAGFTSTNTSKDALIAFQTTGAFQTLTLTAEL